MVRPESLLLRGECPASASSSLSCLQYRVPGLWTASRVFVNIGNAYLVGESNIGPGHCMVEGHLPVLILIHRIWLNNCDMEPHQYIHSIMTNPKQPPNQIEAQIIREISLP